MSIEPVHSAPVTPPIAAPTPDSLPVKRPGPVDVAPSAPPREPDGHRLTNEALQAVQTAARVYEELRQSGRELHFDKTATGMLSIEVYDGSGRLVRRIPPTEALGLAMQETTWLA